MFFVDFYDQYICFSNEGKDCKNKISFVMQPLQNPPLCSSTDKEIVLNFYQQPSSTFLQIVSHVRYSMLHSPISHSCTY
jgi:hypothetical protein